MILLKAFRKSIYTTWIYIYYWQRALTALWGITAFGNIHIASSFLLCIISICLFYSLLVFLLISKNEKLELLVYVFQDHSFMTEVPFVSFDFSGIAEDLSYVLLPQVIVWQFYVWHSSELMAPASSSPGCLQSLSYFTWKPEMYIPARNSLMVYMVARPEKYVGFFSVLTKSFSCFMCKAVHSFTSKRKMHCVFFWDPPFLEVVPRYTDGIAQPAADLPVVHRRSSHLGPSLCLATLVSERTPHGIRRGIV